MSRINRKYGHIRPKEPPTSFRKYDAAATLPSSFDTLKALKTPIAVYNQLDLGACTAHGAAFVYQYDRVLQGNADETTPSRLAIYYYERVAQGTVDQDSGATITQSIQTLANPGIIDESLWPYDTTKYQIAPPTSKTKQVAVTYQAVKQDLQDLKQTLVNGRPITFGFTVYASFESDAVAKTGIVPMPQPNEQVMGGHCTVITGYDDSKSAFIVRNSWGTDWGVGGYFYLPYAYATDANLSSDFWIVETVTADVVNPPSPVNPSPAPVNPSPAPAPVNPPQPPQPQPNPPSNHIRPVSSIVLESIQGTATIAVGASQVLSGNAKLSVLLSEWNSNALISARGGVYEVSLTTQTDYASTLLNQIDIRINGNVQDSLFNIANGNSSFNNVYVLNAHDKLDINVSNSDSSNDTNLPLNLINFVLLIKKL
jgi:hypothetical protein